MLKKISMHLLIQACLCALLATAFYYFHTNRRERLENYDAQIELYRQGLMELSHQNVAASITAFEQVEDPIIVAREYFLYNKAQAYRAAAALPQGSAVQKRGYIMKALAALERARGLKPAKELARLIEKDMQQTRGALQANLDAALEENHALALLADTAHDAPVDAALIARYLSAQLKNGEKEAANQTAAQYASLLLKPSVIGNLSPAQQDFVKQHAIARKPKAETDKTVTVPFAAIIRSTKATIHSGREILEFLSAQPLLGEKHGREFAKALVDAYGALKKKDGSPTQAERSFLSGMESGYEKLPGAVQREMVEQLWRIGYFAFASKINQHLVAVYPADPATESLVFNGGRLLQDLGDYRKSLDMFRRYADKGRGGDHYEEALFQAAWSSYMLGDAGGLALFSRYREEFPHGGHETGALFFQIKLMEKLQSDPARISSLQNALMSQYPLSFYSIAVRYQLHKTTPVAEDLFAASPSDIEKMLSAIKPTGIAIADQIRLRKYDELRRVGAASFGEWELGEIPFDPDAAAFMYTLAYTIQSTQNIHIKLNLLTRLAQKDDSFHRAIALKDLFPNLYEKEIRDALAKAHLSSTPFVLISSLIRQESAFNPLALSAKKAMGLMQLIESTAETSARAAGVDPDHIDLTQPKENIRLGVATFADLLHKYTGRIHYALAGYNAGQEALNRWVKARGGLEPLDFIEAIPYKETRIYVLTILRNYLVYSQLYDHQTFDKAMAALMAELGVISHQN